MKIKNYFFSVVVNLFLLLLTIPLYPGKEKKKKQNFPQQPFQNSFNVKELSIKKINSSDESRKPSKFREMQEAILNFEKEIKDVKDGLQDIKKQVLDSREKQKRLIGLVDTLIKQSKIEPSKPIGSGRCTAQILEPTTENSENQFSLISSFGHFDFLNDSNDSEDENKNQ